MHAAFRLLPVIAILLCFGPVVHRADAQTREIYVSAVDNRGAPVQDLAVGDVVVREDGVAREVLSVRQAEAPLHIVLLVDDSQAARDATVRLREGLLAFLERLRGRAAIALMTIGDRPTLVEPFTTETAPIEKHVKSIFPRPSAGAYLLDAIVEASRALMKRDGDRRTIVALTFEGVEYSNRQREFVLDELARSRAALHVIAIGTPSQSLSDEMRNRNMVIAEGTERTGGRRDQVLAESGIPDRLRQMADELLHQYLVTYSTPDRLVPPERLSVSTSRAGVTLRAPTRLPAR